MVHVQCRCVPYDACLHADLRSIGVFGLLFAEALNLSVLRMCSQFRSLLSNVCVKPLEQKQLCVRVLVVCMMCVCVWCGVTWCVVWCRVVWYGVVLCVCMCLCVRACALP